MTKAISSFGHLFFEFFCDLFFVISSHAPNSNDETFSSVQSHHLCESVILIITSFFCQNHGYIRLKDFTDFKFISPKNQRNLLICLISDKKKATQLRGL